MLWEASEQSSLQPPESLVPMHNVYKTCMHDYVGWLLELNLMWMQIYEPPLGLSSTFSSGYTCVVGRQQLRQSTWVLSELWVAFNCVGTFPPPTHHLDFITLITPNCLVQQQMWICQTKNAIKGEAAQGALYEDGVGTHLATCFKTLLALLPSFFLSLAVTNFLQSHVIVM